MFGTTNQNIPAKPCVYAFSAAVNIDGAHTHVAAIENAVSNHGAECPAAKNSSFVCFRFLSKSTIEHITAKKIAMSIQPCNCVITCMIKFLIVVTFVCHFCKGSDIAPIKRTFAAQKWFF